jgi:anti-anti-sigma regulatory factor
MGTASRGVSKLVLALAVVSFVGSVTATLLFGTAASAASEPGAHAVAARAAH